MQWRGVMTAITTCFDRELAVDHEFMAQHCRWLVDNGCTAIVALGSLGEAAALDPEEKTKILTNCATALGGRTPLVAGISGLTTKEAVRLAKTAADSGCEGLMILPPYVYQGDEREMAAHISAVLAATSLSCMLYNNPIAYGTDFLPEQIQRLSAQHPNLHAVKESSMDVRRIMAIRALLGDRIAVFVGVDDCILEGIAMGATGSIAGLANALPRELVQLFDLAIAGEMSKAFDLYQWLLPVLRMDAVPKFVQLVKLVQQQVGMGNARVRPPRLELTGAELDEALQLIRRTLANRTVSAVAPGQPALAK